MKIFTLFWLTGEKEIIKGNDIADALRKNGYGGGTMRALDFWKEGDGNDNWFWDFASHQWKWHETGKKGRGKYII